MLALLALLACSGADSTAPEPVTSGSRLRARWEVAAGAERLVGWHDVNAENFSVARHALDEIGGLPATIAELADWVVVDAIR